MLFYEKLKLLVNFIKLENLKENKNFRKTKMKKYFYKSEFIIVKAKNVKTN